MVRKLIGYALTIVAISAALVGCAPQKELLVSDAGQNKMWKDGVIGVVSVGGQVFNRFRTGLTVFATEQEQLGASDLNLDGVIETTLIEALYSRALTTKNLSSARSALTATNNMIAFGVHGIALDARPQWTDYKTRFISLAKQEGVSIIALVRTTTFGDPIGGLGKFPRGVGIARTRELGNRSALYAMLDITFVDGRSGQPFAKIDIRKDDGSRNGVTPTASVADHLGWQPQSTYTADDYLTITRTLKLLLDQPIREAVAKLPLN